MILVTAATALIVLAMITKAGVFAIERSHPPSGQMIDVAGGRLHIVDMGPRGDTAPALVLIHGASSNLEAMREPLGSTLARRHRVILVDRPGHGWSTRDRLEDSTPAIQAAMINEALGKLGVARAILVAHSWAGALGLAMALDHPERVAGLVLLAPVTHPWNGGVGWYNDFTAMPVIGSIFAHTLALPLGIAVMESGAKSVFQPEQMPAGYVRDRAVALLMRPSEFMANAYDLVTLKQSVAAQVGRYGAIKVPMVLIAGDADTTVSIDVHSRPFVAAVPNAKLVVLPGVGHMTQNAAPDVVIKQIDAMIAGMAPASIAAAH